MSPATIVDGINKRCDLPPEAYMTGAYTTGGPKSGAVFAKRPGYNNTGTVVNIGVNQFRVTGFKPVTIHQYDVSVSPEPKHPVVYQKIWADPDVAKKLDELPHPWVYDGRKLAWSVNEVEIRVEVDLGKASSKPGRANQQFMVIIRPSCKISMAVLKAYLSNKASWDTKVLECMNFLDHVLRQGASERFKLIKRTFFNEEAQRKPLGSSVEAVRGVYAAIRLNESINAGQLGLGVNVDVSNQAFWVGQNFLDVVRNYINAGSTKKQYQNDDLWAILKPKVDGASITQSDAFKTLRRLCRMRFVTNHSKDRRSYSIDSFYFDKKYGKEGANAKTVKFPRRMEDGTTKEETIFNYYAERYGFKIQHWQLPLVKTSKGGYFPMEACTIERLNPYKYKLDANQTSEMIKFAVQRPPERKNQIAKSVGLLQWDKDSYLKSFGIQISSAMPSVKSRVLKNPELQFGNGGKLNPGVTGRWDLRGKTFFIPNRQPLDAWAFVVLDGAVDDATARNFVNVFARTYKGHGGNVTAMPIMERPTRGKPWNQLVRDAFTNCGNSFKKMPKIIFFVVPRKETHAYEMIKKYADCYDAVPSQVLLANHVRKADGQYCSNVCMKVNAKLGGQTSKAVGGAIPLTGLTDDTVFIGVDVSHAAPGQQKASIASMCLSMDGHHARYLGNVETNGWREEILVEGNVTTMLKPMLESWVKTHRKVPANVFYFRDGVSEGQFSQVMSREYTEMKQVFKSVGPANAPPPKFTVIIATKRHHVRFFPERGDRNGNPLPGTLVEREVTHPFHYDFYLCSHVAIQGTARPVHYSVIHDEIKLKVDVLQSMIYNHCYQYARSTTPVSLHPAVYYAHLLGNRASSHINVPDNGEANPTSAGDPTATSRRDLGPAPRLIGLGCGSGVKQGAKDFFVNTMWYI